MLKMRTIIAGSRTITNYDDFLRAIAAAPWKPTAVISGAARGADALGERWARENNIPLLRMPADWNKHGNRAGFVRNIEMAARAEALIAVWDGRSRGTAHMIETAQNRGLRIFVRRFRSS
jgi:hypothetical protein